MSDETNRDPYKEGGDLRSFITGSEPEVAPSEPPFEAYPQPSETSELAEAGARGAVCPRCESWEVVAGHLLDGLGQKIRFGLMYRQRAPGVSDNEAPPVVALYCNACGEVTFTLE